jgi:hypothetical protein
VGEGLHVPLDSFGVGLIPNEAATFTHGVTREWTIEAFSAAEGYPAAVVHNGGEPRSIQFFEREPFVAV